jgi:KaiC/GvpD/RAD55 family RecA-like ATPase
MQQVRCWPFFQKEVGVNSFSELAQRHGMKAVLTCVGQPVSSLPDDWDPGRKAPSTYPESWAGFHDLVASWRARASKLTIPQEQTLSDRQQRRYPLHTAAELSAMPLAKYRVKNVLPREGLAAIFGPPGVAKSFLALDLAFTLSDGGEWCGYRVEQCDVLHLCLEGQGGLPQRVQAYREHRGRDTGKRIRFITAPFSLLSQNDVDALVRTVKDAGIRAGVIVIDTLSAATAGADENSSVDMGRLLQVLKHLYEEFGVLVILVHHSGKDAQKGLRGHSSLLAALDAVIEVRRDEDRRSWRLVKSKDGVDGKEHPFRLLIVELGIDEDGDPINSCVIVPEERAADAVKRVKIPASGNQRIVYEVAGELLRRSSDYGKGGAKAARPCIRIEDLIDASHGRLPVEDRRVTERARDAIRGLVNKGCLILREDWIWVP